MAWHPPSDHPWRRAKHVAVLQARAIAEKRLDGLNVLLLPFTALIFAFVLLVQPSTLALERGLRRVLLAEAVTLATFLSSDPFVLTGLWCLSAGGGWYELRLQGDAGRGPARVFAGYLLPSSALLLIGAVASTLDSAPARTIASLSIALAVMIRKGIVPLHSWLPELFAATGVEFDVGEPMLGRLVGEVEAAIAAS